MQKLPIIILVIITVLVIPFSQIDGENHPKTFMAIAIAETVLFYAFIVSLWLSSRR